MPFYNLYPELRNIIYRHYFSIDGGYHFNHESRRLTTQDGRPIDLALRSVSSLIARETLHLPFHLNCVTFSTGCPSATQASAMGIYLMLSDMDWHKMVAYDGIAPFLTPEVYEAVAEEHPDFTRIMDQIPIPRNSPHFHYVWHSGGVPSACDEASRMLLRTMIEVHGETPVVEAILRAWQWPWPRCFPGTPLHPLTSLLAHYRPWDFPSKETARVLIKATSGMDSMSLTQKTYGSNDFTAHKFRYSAAAAAIDFLKGLSKSARLRLENLILHEDQPSISSPSRHALGLIPFCIENPLLRVERRVSLFGSILCDDGIWSKHPLSQAKIPGVLSTWLVEALALVPAGMPAGSFSLVIVGDPAPEMAAEIFENFVLLAASMQTAIGEAHSRGILSRSSTFLERVQHPCYVMEDFPRAVTELLDANNSSIRCNFPLKNTWDVERLIHERKDWTSDDWARRFTHPLSPECQQYFRSPLQRSVEIVGPRDGYADPEHHAFDLFST